MTFTECSALNDQDAPLRIGYLLRMYPRFSQTFVVNEILELERQEAEVHILSLRKPTDGRFQESICRVRAGVDYVPELFVEERRKTVQAHGELWRSRPGRYLQVLARTLRHKGAALADFRQAALVLRAARKRRLGHLHVHFGTGEATVAWLAKLLGGPSYSLTLHAFDIFRDDVDRRLLAEKINGSRFTVTVSEFNRRWMADHLPGVQVDKIRVNYNGIDLERFRPTPGSRDPFLVLAVGRLIEKKGFIDLVRAVAHLRGRGLPVACTIVGDGPETDRLRAEIRQLGLGGVVTLAGPLGQDRVRDLLGRASCFALPCVQAADGNLDALPTVLLEAMAAGCPCVSTTVSGVPEIVAHEETGLLVAPGQPRELAAAMGRVLDAPEEGVRLAVAGRRRAEKLFDIQANVGRLRGWFEEVLPGRTAAPRDVQATCGPADMHTAVEAA
jgi:glycosyltransferase involved in cell wall biosynthesis